MPLSSSSSESVETPPRPPRPLSPHLMSYSFQSNMAFSILHRITGIGLAVGLCLLVVWMYAVASGPEAYASLTLFLDSWLGRTLCVCWGLALCYHAATGLRHLVWDTGRGLSLDTLIRSNIVVVFMAVIFAAILFFV